MSTEKGQATLKRWRELLETVKKVSETKPSLQGGVEEILTTIEGLEASIEECEDHYKIRLSCEVKGEGYRLSLDIPYKTDSRKVAFSPNNFLSAVARHLDYKDGDILEFKIKLPKPST